MRDSGYTVDNDNNEEETEAKICHKEQKNCRVRKRVRKRAVKAGKR